MQNPDRHPGWFTTAYFHRPEELAAERAVAGLDVVETVRVEGLAGWLGHLAPRLDDDADGLRPSWTPSAAWSACRRCSGSART